MASKKLLVRITIFQLACRVGTHMKKLLLASGLVACALLSGCAPVLIGTAAVTTTAVLADRRNVGNVANDNVIETKAALLLTQANFSSSHITTTAFEGRVLLSGEIGTEEEKEKATEIVSSISGVSVVYNELQVGESASLGTRMSDSVTASKVRASLVDTKGITLTSVKVVVEQGVVYLMGTVTQKEADVIMDVASRVTGVTKVVSLLEIISTRELDRRKNREDAEAQANKIKEQQAPESRLTDSQGEPVAQSNPI